MTLAYWAQWDKSDLDSWMCKDVDDDADLEQEKDDTNLHQEDSCPRCSSGCNYCLMTEW